MLKLHIVGLNHNKAYVMIAYDIGGQYTQK